MKRPLNPVVAVVACVAAALAVWLIAGGGEPGSGRASGAPTSGIAAGPPSRAATAPASQERSTAPTVDDLLARFEPDEGGRVSAVVTGTELTAIANDRLPADSPVERVDLAVAQGGDRPRVNFTAALRGSDLDATGAVALGLVDGAVEPDLLEARVGPLPLAGGFRDPVDTVIDDAAAVFDEVAARGVVITSLTTQGDALRVEGRMSPGA